MNRFRKAIALITILFVSLPGFSQEPLPQDTLLIIDSMHQASESAFDEDSDFNESIAINRPLPRLPDTLTFRKVSDSIAAGLKKQKAFEYANDPAYWVRKPEPTENVSFSIWKKIADFLSRPAVRAFVYLLLAGLAIFLIIKIILLNNLYIFKSSNKKAKPVDELSEAALMEENLDELINDAMRRNDQRAVVRFQYTI